MNSVDLSEPWFRMPHDARLAFLSQSSSDVTSDVTRLPICRVLNEYEQYYVKCIERKNNSWNLRLNIYQRRGREHRDLTNRRPK